VLTFLAATGVRDDKVLERAEVLIFEPMLEIGMGGAVTEAGVLNSFAREATDRAFLRGFASVLTFATSVFRVLVLRSRTIFLSCSTVEVPIAGERVADDTDLFRAEAVPVWRLVEETATTLDLRVRVD
jgi:hypothetical protein